MKKYLIAVCILGFSSNAFSQDCGVSENSKNLSACWTKTRTITNASLAAQEQEGKAYLKSTNFIDITSKNEIAKDEKAFVELSYWKLDDKYIQCRTIYRDRTGKLTQTASICYSLKSK